MFWGVCIPVCSIKITIVISKQNLPIKYFDYQIKKRVGNSIYSDKKSKI